MTDEEPCKTEKRKWNLQKLLITMFSFEINQPLEATDITGKGVWTPTPPSKKKATMFLWQWADCALLFQPLGWHSSASQFSPIFLWMEANFFALFSCLSDLLLHADGLFYGETKEKQLFMCCFFFCWTAFLFTSSSQQSYEAHGSLSDHLPSLSTLGQSLQFQF